MQPKAPREHGRERASRCVSDRRSGATHGCAAPAPATSTLLDLDFCPLLFQSSFDLFSFVLGDAFLDGLGRSVDEILGLLEAEAGQLTDDLDDRDLVGADLGQGRGELGLLLGSGRHLGGSATGGRGGGSSSRGSGGDAVALLEALDELGQLENGHLVDRFEQIVLGQDSHVMSPSTCVLGVRSVGFGSRYAPGSAAAFWSATCWRA